MSVPASRAGHSGLAFMVVAATIALALSGCGGDDPASPVDTGGNSGVTSAVIGPAGGKVATPDGNASLEIPAGALDANTTITIAPRSTPGTLTLVAGTAYRFGPDGTEFKLPVALTLRYDPADVTQTGELYVTDFSDGDDVIRLARSTHDDVAHEVTGEIWHFSDKAIGACGACAAGIGDLTAEWDPDLRANVLNWENQAGIRVLVSRVRINDFGTPPFPSTPYRSQSGAVTRFVDGGLGVDAAIFWYWVQVQYANIIGPPSDPVFVSYFGYPDPPEPVQGLHVTALPGDPTGLRVSWQPNSTAQYYELQRVLPASNWAVVAGNIPYSDYYRQETGLPEQTMVTYRIRGVSDNGIGAWTTATGETGASCVIDATIDGQPAVGPFLTGTIVELAAVNCGAEPERSFEWIYGYGGDEFVVSTDPTYTLEVYSDITIALRVLEDGMEVETLTYDVEVLVPPIFTQLNSSEIKPDRHQSFTLDIQALDGTNWVPLIPTFPEVDRIEITIHELVNFIPTNVVLERTLTTQSSTVIAGDTLPLGWYRITALGKAADGSILAAPTPLSIEVVPVR